MLDVELNGFVLLLLLLLLLLLDKLEDSLDVDNELEDSLDVDNELEDSLDVDDELEELEIVLDDVLDDLELVEEVVDLLLVLGGFGAQTLKFGISNVSPQPNKFCGSNSGIQSGIQGGSII
jgi:hypothetical protein